MSVFKEYQYDYLYTDIVHFQISSFNIEQYEINFKNNYKNDEIIDLTRI
jgi:hypothetical protein